MTTAKDILAKYGGSGPPPLGTVVLCEGEEWELEVKVPRPTGAHWLKRYPVLVKFVTEFGREMFPEQFNAANSNGDLEVDVIAEEDVEERSLDYETVLNAMEKFFGDDDFIKDYVPAVFGMSPDNTDEMMYLQTFMGPKEIINPFMEAAVLIIQYGGDREDVQEAQKKSPPEAGEEEVVAA